MAAAAARSVTAGDADSAAREVLARVKELAGGHQLLEAAREREDVELVGGATRDLLIGTTPRELDVVVAADAEALARQLASTIGAEHGRAGAGAGESGAHERFGTAYLVWDGGRIDIASRRAESYPAPGALPVVRQGTPEEDLQRRDFTVNAIAVALGGSRPGELRHAPGALEDLAAGRLRVLHEHSFRDDPTRLLRLARYGARLSFKPDEHTAKLAATALADGALATVSGARLGAELRLALREPDPHDALLAFARHGVLGALEPPLQFDEQTARLASDGLPGDARVDILLLGCLLLSLRGSDPESESSMRGLLDRLEFPAADRDRAIATAQRAPELAQALASAGAPSQVRAAVSTAPAEAVALAAVLPQAAVSARAAARSWLSELRHVALRISGDDLIAAGIAEGPEIGRRLRATLDMRLDGQLEDSRQAQLRAALQEPA